MFKNSVLFMSVAVVGLSLVSTADAIKTQQTLDGYFTRKPAPIKGLIQKKYKVKKSYNHPDCKRARMIRAYLTKI